jgi:hypothetical protein
MFWSSSTKIIQVFLDNLGEKNLISLKFHAMYLETLLPLKVLMP